MTHWFKKNIDLKLFKYLTLFFTLTMLIQTYKLVYWKKLGFIEDTDWFDLYVYVIFFKWLFVLIYMLFVSQIIKWTFEKGINWLVRVLLHLLLAVFLFFFAFSLSSLYIYTFAHFTIEQALAQVSFNKFMDEIDETFLIYFTLIGIIHGYYYIKKLERIEQQKSQLKIQLAHSKMNILTTQMQPNFVFNTLNTLTSLIDEDKEQSLNLIADFGDLFRTIIDYKDDDLIYLEKELQFLEKFYALVSIRNPKGFTIHKTIESGLENILIPSMILQTIQENILKNYALDKNTGLKIELNIYKKNKYLCIILKSTGELIKQKTNNLLKKETFIKILKMRLQSLYKNDYKFTCKRVDNSILVQIKIPI